MAAGHAELIGELASIEKMSMPDRLKHAKKRRAQQLKAYTQYEKQLNKEISKRAKKGQGSGTHSVASRSIASRIRFDPSILLLEATMRNDVEEVNNLLNAGVDPNVSNEDGLRALHQCSIDNLEEVMKLLIQFGANVNVCDTELWTPLHAAATCGHMNACKYLIEHGAELLAVNSDGNMPYDLCEDPDTLDYIESEMAKRGVTQEMIDDIRLSSENKLLFDLKQLHENGGDLEYVGSNGETPLHIAACNGYVYVTEFLLFHHVAVNIPDDDGWMPLHCAACWSQLPVIDLLLQNGADFGARTKNGETTLDLCDDIEMKQKVLEIVEEVENKQPHKSRDSSMKRRNSAARKGSTATAHAMRRTNPHEKSSIAHIEAQDEAMRLRESISSINDEDEEDENFAILDAITVPQSMEAEDVILDLPKDPAVNISSQQKVESKPIKSIISKGSQERNSQNKSFLLSTDIWMSQTQDDAPEKKTSDVPTKGGKDVKKDNKRENKKDKDILAKNIGKNTSDVPSANGNKSSSNSVTSSKSANASMASGEAAASGAKQEAATKDSSESAKMPAEVPKAAPAADLLKDGKTEAPSGVGARDARAQMPAQSAGAKTPAPSEGKNRSKEEVPLSHKKSSKAPNIGAEDLSKGLKTACNPASGSKVMHCSPNSHLPDGSTGQTPPSGTLADLKKQRAKRMQDTLVSVTVRENGKPAAASVSNTSNGGSVSANDRNANIVPRATQAPYSSGVGDKPQRRYSNTQEVVEGDDHRCCTIL